jgi:hypothetical protein
VTEARAQVEERLAQVSNFFQTVNGAIAKAALNDDGEIKNAQLRAIGDLVTDRFDVLASEAERVNSAVVSRLQTLANSVTTRVGERVGAVRDSATQAVGGAAQRVTGAVSGAVSAATAPAREVIDAQLANLSSTVEAQKDKAIAYLNKTIGETLTEEVLELVNVQGRLNASLEQLSGLGDSDQAEKARKLINEKLGEASDLLLSTTRAIGDFVANADGDSIRGNVDSLRASIRDRFDGFREAIDGTQNTIEASIRQLQEQAEAAMAPRSFGERVQQVAGGAVATVRGAVGAGRATVQAGQTVAAATKEAVQSDRGQGVIQVIGNTAKALVSVGQTGYKVAKAFESVALDVIPFGNALKTVTQQVVLPAAGAVAVSQFIPGADQILPTIQAGAASVINPIIQGGVADLTAQASGVISSLPGFIQGAATQSVAQIASGIGSAVEVITVNGATVAIAGGAAALAGRAGGVVAGRAGQQVAQGVQNFVTPSQPTAPQAQATQSQEPQRQADAANAQLSAVVQSIKSLAERLDGSFGEASKQVENSLRAGATGLAAIQQQQSAVSEDAAVAQINGVLDQLRRVGAEAQDIAAIEQERDRIVARQAELRSKVAAATAEASALGEVVGLDNLSDDVGEAFSKVLNATNKLLAEFAEVEAQARLIDTAKAAAGSPKVQGIAKDLAINTVATGASVVASKAAGATGMNVAGLSADFTAALVARLGFGAAEAFREVLAQHDRRVITLLGDAGIRPQHTVRVGETEFRRGG